MPLRKFGLWLASISVRFAKSRLTKKFVTNPTSLTGLLLIVGFIIIAALAPVLAPPPPAPWNPYMIPRDSYLSEPQPPNAEHPLGTTSSQYDIYYGLIWGTRTAFKVGLIVTACAGVIGIIVGSFAAFYGGLVDEAIMRVTDIFMTLPFLIAAMVLVTILGQGLEKVMIALIVFGWMGYARLIRSDILSIKEMDYVSAAKALGASDTRILFRHIIPNAIFPTIVTATMSAGSMVITASSLSFLGLGSPLGYADWGQMISFARNWMLGTQGNPAQYWYTVVYPGAAILLFCLGWNLMGDAFRDILDPRLRGTH